jgi:CheY-like chemotaxis protein
LAEAIDGQESVELALQLRPDVVLLDISMPVFGGIEATRRIREKLPEIQHYYRQQSREPHLCGGGAERRRSRLRVEVVSHISASEGD